MIAIWAQRHARITTGLKRMMCVLLPLLLRTGATPCPDHDGIETGANSSICLMLTAGATPCPDHDGIETNSRGADALQLFAAQRHARITTGLKHGRSFMQEE